MLKKHAILTAVGLVVGLLTLAWVQPLTSAGATLLLLLVVVLLNAIAALPVKAFMNAFKPAGPARIKSARARRTRPVEPKAGKPAVEKEKMVKP